MREILFRGKRVDNGEWIQGDIVQFPVHGVVRIVEQEPSYKDAEVDSDTVGQYTGLTDKNGRKIFEGDILKVKQHGEMGLRTCAIYFGEYIDADSVFGDYRCIGFYLKVVDECCSIGGLLDSDFEFEIIGNIYDNPELVGGESDG